MVCLLGFVGGSSSVPGFAAKSGASSLQLAPLLCAGIIGYRALLRAELPPGGRLGIYGFGASAHLTAQVALAQSATVRVPTRAEPARRLALELGAASAGHAYDAPPESLDAAILFAPVGDLMPVVPAALDAGGTLAVAGIHLTDIPVLNYAEHLFRERTLRSVTANTRADGPLCSTPPAIPCTSSPPPTGWRRPTWPSTASSAPPSSMSAAEAP